jgi:hypothetical protein
MISGSDSARMMNTMIWKNGPSGWKIMGEKEKRIE